ncbi:MAG: RNA polymerase sigma factor [Bacteroidota bacterium]
MELRQLISECAKCSITAQRYLFDNYANRFLLLCQRYLKQREEAEEAMMNGFLQIYQALSRFNFSNDASTIAWMKKIMVNKCLEIIRTRHRLLIVMGEENAEQEPADDWIYEQLEVNSILACLAKLPVGYRTVFNLFVIEGYSHEEIAALLRISAGASKSQLSKAKRHLQRLISEQNNYGQHAAQES